MKHAKRAVLVVAFMLSVSAVSFAADIVADSRIARITAYPDSAMISRQAAVKLSPQDTRVIFADIIPEIDEASLKASVAAAGVKLLGVTLRRQYLEEVPSDRIQKLKDQLQQLEDDGRRLQDTKNVLREEKMFLDALRVFSQAQLPKDLVTKVPAPAEIDGLYKFLDVRLRENYSAVMDIELKERELHNQIEAVRRQLAEIAGPVKKQKRFIEVELQSGQSVSTEITVSYLVRGVSWEASYDARADFEKQEVELVLYGLIRQNTGEDWTNVEMNLSTARPTVGGNMPYVEPWILRPFQPQVYRERKMSKLAGAVQSMAFKEENDAVMDREGLGMPTEAPVYATAQEKGVAVIYSIPRAISVKADGAEVKIPVSAQMLKAVFTYSTYPRAVPLAFLGSRVTNARDLQLLPGRVNIFLDGDFVGASSLGGIGPGEEFDLYLGSDENVKVKRDQVEKKVDQTLIGTIASPNRQTVLKYKLGVENYKSRKIKVKLFEAMPVPEDDRIKVKMNQVSLEPKVKDWENRKGVWLWEFDLEPKAKQEIFYSFTVDHPREMQVEGMSYGN
ncbi:MAG TPA: mucoidy inhibitor MuiA family protein [Candidatus Omnitrophota bacterium]|nr:mucoidy inhibitor MuiA family protein [Candidatus Omnitrophota bacterium]HRZ15731.1 mucoidy inhibitor MuiA family protein [Candidatus Omnitrophota bacterium]